MGSEPNKSLVEKLEGWIRLISFAVSFGGNVSLSWYQVIIHDVMPLSEDLLFWKGMAFMAGLSTVIGVWAAWDAFRITGETAGQRFGLRFAVVMAGFFASAWLFARNELAWKLQTTSDSASDQLEEWLGPFLYGLGCAFAVAFFVYAIIGLFRVAQSVAGD